MKKNDENLKVTSISSIPENMKKHMPKVKRLAVVTLASLMLVNSNAISNNIVQADQVAVSDSFTEDEEKVIQSLINNGCDQQILLDFKSYLLNTYASQSESDKNIITEDECMFLGVTYENDGVQVPLWWDDSALIKFKNLVGESLLKDSTVEVAETVETEMVTEEVEEPVLIVNDVVETEKQLETEPVNKVHEIKNFGDATDDAQVTAKAQMVIDYFTNAGIINLQTGDGYTIEEVKDIIRFMNAAYLPKDESDAFTMVDRCLDFTCGPLSSVSTLDIVNYMANSDVVTKEMVEADIQQAPMINWVDALLMGDSYCYPYLNWFAQKYIEMMSTTDRDLFISIYNELTQSLADLLYGDGYTIDGVTYNINDFAGLRDINDGNVLQFFAFLYQVGRVDGVKEDYVVTQRQAGEAVVNIEDILRLLNVECAEDIANKAEYDTEGKLVFPQYGNGYSENLDNFEMRLQTNTINAALENYHLKNLSAYEDNFMLSLTNN